MRPQPIRRFEVDDFVKHRRRREFVDSSRREATDPPYLCQTIPDSGILTKSCERTWRGSSIASIRLLLHNYSSGKEESIPRFYRGRSSGRARRA
jgi:hypothetical protein